MARRSRRFRFASSQLCQPYNPGGLATHRFGLIRFRSPLLTESLLLSFPADTEMFHFPALALRTYVFSTQ